MGIEFSGFDDFERKLTKDVSDWASESSTEHFALGAAARAREAGLNTVDGMTLDIRIEGDTHGLVKIDEAEVRRRANEILATDSAPENA